MADTYVVVVEHNLVTAVQKMTDGAGASVPQTKLEVGTQLADNYRSHGCIDGRYYFDNAQRARIFATLCLEFTRALIDKRLDVVKVLPADADYCATNQSTDSAEA